MGILKNKAAGTDWQRTAMRRLISKYSMEWLYRHAEMTAITIGVSRVDVTEWLYDYTETLLDKKER